MDQWISTSGLIKIKEENGKGPEANMQFQMKEKNDNKNKNEWIKRTHLWRTHERTLAVNREMNKWKQQPGPQQQQWNNNNQKMHFFVVVVVVIAYKIGKCEQLEKSV